MHFTSALPSLVRDRGLLVLGSGITPFYLPYYFGKYSASDRTIPTEVVEERSQSHT